ncbi:MAG: GNAT family N-acetyltransferase [Microbacteriaceae bacterium]
MMPFTIERVDYLDERALALRAEMDAEMGALYADVVAGPELQEWTAAAFAIDPAAIVETVLVLDDDRPIGHGALRPLGDRLEVKRIFVTVDARGQGISRMVMDELERLAVARGIRELVLQTGERQVASVALYENIGYVSIPVFGPYVGVQYAICFEKRLT